jgi:hypothetical protein
LFGADRFGGDWFEEAGKEGATRKVRNERKSNRNRKQGKPHETEQNRTDKSRKDSDTET